MTSCGTAEIAGGLAVLRAAIVSDGLGRRDGLACRMATRASTPGDVPGTVAGLEVRATLIAEL
jgi:hypothetical protein